MAKNITQRRSPGSVQPFVTLNPSPVISTREPTIYDNYDPSTIWIQQYDESGTPVNSVWILASVQNGQAEWIKVSSSGGEGVFKNIFLPNTDTAQTQGVFYFNNDRWIIRYGSNNVFFGLDSGNTTLDLNSANENTGIGTGGLSSLTIGFGNSTLGRLAGHEIADGYRNSLFGAGAGITISSGFQNSAFGALALSNLIDGNNCIAIGNESGSSYTASEDHNICIGNNGITSDSGKIRIGNDIDHNESFIAGTMNVSKDIVSEQALFAQGESISPPAGIGISGTIETSQSTGNMNIKSTTTNPGDNTGYIKFYINGATVYVPYFTNIAP